MTSSAASGSLIAFLFPLAIGCGAPARPQDPTPVATVSVPAAEAVASDPVAIPTPSSSAQAPPSSAPTIATAAPSPAAGGLRASTAMAMDSNVVAEKLVAEVNRQIGPIGRCAEIIRKTDNVVGSLNLQVTISKDGHVTPSLQSPVNPEAEKCLLDGIRAWSIAGAGHGRAMVLLEIKATSGGW